jgi:hypothetical protein
MGKEEIWIAVAEIRDITALQDREAFQRFTRELRRSLFLRTTPC